MRLLQRALYSFCIAIAFAAGLSNQARAQIGSSIPRFDIKLPASHKEPVTGRIFVIIAKAEDPEPRLQVGSWRSHTEFLGKDVVQLQPGQSTTLDALTLGYPFKSIR